MDLRLQPKPEIEITIANQGIVSRKQFFVKKEFEEIRPYFFPALFIRNWKPKAELIYPQVSDETAIQYECDFNREVQNCFVEDYAEEVYLKTPPPCFVVFGKLTREVNKLSQKIANEFGSVLIQVDDIVNQVIKTETETAKVLVRILRLGVALTLNFILALLSFVAHTAEARHRGYVLCGLPILPLSHDLPVEQQFNYLFTWENKPTVFINVLFDDEDLIKERANTRIQLKNGSIEYYSLCNEVPEEDESEDENDEMLSIKDDTCYEPNIDISPSRAWPQLPRDEESQVWSELELFDKIIRPVVELITSRIDPQYFITVDSRVKNEFNIIQARLSLLQIWKAPLAVPVFPSKIVANIESEEDEERATDSNFDSYSLQIAEEPPATAFLTLFSKKTISPKYRWELSHYNYICPVSLRAGRVVEGKSQFAVMFIKYIYFLYDEQAMRQFIQNPRAFVLPIRPKPPCRFVILGYPLSGKTALAKFLATEFSIPLIDLDIILQDDLIRKKETYKKFCRQKAECREISRLTALAWQDWRLEEERRVNLIEEWIIYIQTLLSKRIDQFYTKEKSVESSKSSELERKGSTREESDEDLGATPLEVRGIGIDVVHSDSNTRHHHPESQSITTSEIIIQAIQHQDFDFNRNRREVEANLFFSTLWSSFSGADLSVGKSKNEGEESERISEYGEDKYSLDETKDSINWCNLLPPQSLSSLLLSKTPYTTREKRQSFKLFLEAASKVYWEPSSLKTEFSKWRLPCFMNIPLCEVYLDNPILLLKYMPEWLRERPLIPDPIGSDHPSVINAVQKADMRADIVNVERSSEEIAILLRNALEKAEREGMRVTGEVISPGGWVVDNMVLDLNVWVNLACENVFVDHIYILIDKEPELTRIINIWWDLFGKHAFSSECLTESSTFSEAETESEEKEGSQNSKEILNEKSNIQNSVMGLLIETATAIEEGDSQLDEIYEIMKGEMEESLTYKPPFFLDVFCQSILRLTAETIKKLQEEHFEDVFAMIYTLANEFRSTADFYGKERMMYGENRDFFLGVHLEVVTAALLNRLKKKTVINGDQKYSCKKSIENGLEFFISLLSIPKKLKQLKNLFKKLHQNGNIHTLDITNKRPEDLFNEIKEKLMEPFIKKPRDLENFEVEEIKKSTEKYSEFKKKPKKEYENSSVESQSEEEEQEEEEEEDEEEDVRIFGEANQLCIVSLERDIFLLGKPEIALRYYGKLYYFWDEEAKKKFINDPEKYAPYYSAIRTYPPLRIFITGPAGAGKTTIAKYLSKQFSIPFIDYSEFLVKTLIPHSDSLYNKFSSLSDQKLLLSDNHNPAAKSAIERFLNSSYQNRHYWFECSAVVDYDEKNSILKKIMSVRQPVTFLDIPEVSFEFAESVTSEKDEEYEELLSEASDYSYTSMKEIETIVGNYLNFNNGLSEYCVSRTFKTLWNKEPYTTLGFVIDGFPLRSSDIKHMTNNSWIPDLIIEVTASEEVAIKRYTDTLMKSWYAQLKREEEEQKFLEATLQNVYKTWASIREKELFDEKFAEAQLRMKSSSFTKENADDFEEIFQGSQTTSKSFVGYKSALKKEESKDYESEVSLPEEIQEQIQEEISEILSKEIPVLEFHPIFESYEAGKTRVTENLKSVYKKNIEEIEKIKTELQKLEISWFRINGVENLQKILRNLHIKLDKIKKRVLYRKEFAFTIKPDIAEALLQQGYYFLSKFGRWCPVQVYRLKNPINMFRPFSGRGKITPIAYRNYIYFVAGEYEKEQFLEDPIKYTFNERRHPNIPLRVAIIGPPKCGKSSLSARLGAMFDLKVITMGTALRFALEKAPRSTLAKSIDGYLKRGCFLPLSLKVEALMMCLNDPSCVTQGFVFDGIPFDAALTQSLAERGKLPFVIISLVAKPHFGKTNRQNLDLAKFRLPYKNRTNLDERYQDWNDTYKRFAQWNEDTYNNLYEVNAKASVVEIFYQAYDIIRKSFLGILYYVQYCVSDRVVPLEYLCVSQNEYELRKSFYQNNCPVCWLEKHKLSNSTDRPNRSGLVQYKQHFYWVCSEHMEKFVSNPRNYFPPHIPNWPEKLPKRIKRNSVDTNSTDLKIHGHGRCPVTRIDFPSRLDWEGSWDYAVSYDGEIFLCKNEEMMERFLTTPWRYAEADTQFEVNRNNKSGAVRILGPPILTSLPPIGFLEQTVANLIQKSLQVLGVVRPVYSNLSPSVTGCIYIALYLKAHNKKKKQALLEREYLSFMTTTCQASNYKTTDIALLEREVGQGDFETESEDELQSLMDEEGEGLNSPRTNRFEVQVEKNLWSAKKTSEQHFEMKFTPEDELVEIPEHPKVIVLLKYPIQSLRPFPFPEIPNCINFIYSAKQGLELREKFNYRSLYQPPPSWSALFPEKVSYNPDRKFDLMLYENKRPSFPSEIRVVTGKRAVSNLSLREQFRPGDPESQLSSQYMIHRCIPRFQLVDKILNVNAPSLPRVEQDEATLFDPLREYSYTMLFSEFFHTSHVVRCFRTTETQYFSSLQHLNIEKLEFAHLLDHTLGLTNIPTEFLVPPQRTASMTSRTSLDSYQLIFDAATLFAIASEETIAANVTEKSSVSSIFTFIQTLLFEKLDEIFRNMSTSTFSYDTFEIKAVTEPKTRKPIVVFEEVLPYPPLPWDIISRPYHAFCSVFALFDSPMVENIAHERNFSLLDGLPQLEFQFRYLKVSVPESGQPGKPRTPQPVRKAHFFAYDFFNLPWTLFLTHSHLETYNQEIENNFVDDSESKKLKKGLSSTSTFSNLFGT